MTERSARGTVTCDLCKGRGWLLQAKSKINIELNSACLELELEGWLTYVGRLLPVVEKPTTPE